MLTDAMFNMRREFYEQSKKEAITKNKWCRDCMFLDDCPKKEIPYSDCPIMLEDLPLSQGD